MVRYFEAGEKPVNIVVDQSHPKLTVTQHEEVSRMWGEILLTNPSAFDGEVWSCSGVTETDEEVKLTVGITRYSVTTWGRKTQAEVEGTRSMGTAVLIFERKSGDMILARRTDQVVYDQGKVSVIGGVVDTDIPLVDGDFMSMVYLQSKKELFEELNVVNPSEIIYIGVAGGPGEKIEWCFAVEVDDATIKDETEATELIWIPRNEIPDLVLRGNLEMSTGWHLEHWAEKITNSTGLDFVEARN